jgi:Rrf2 family protein
MTQEADYAVRIVYCLAESGERRGAKYISERMRVSLRFSLKILRKLVASGIVKSYKGQRGGYELARSPEKITLNDVIETVDGPYVISRCLRAGHECSMEDSADCNFRAVYADVSEGIKKKLSGVTFKAMLERQPLRGAPKVSAD